MPLKMEQRARGTGAAVGWIRCRAGQIIASQQRVEGGARRIVEGWIRNPEVEILRQERMLKRHAGLEVVLALHVGHVRAKARVGQFSLLIERRRGTAGNESGAVRKHVSARSEEHTSELQSLTNLVCRLLLEKKK